ncbi:putative nucleotidyltransferase, ribonuclease H, partial [Tanacetum coccineum]
SVLTDPEVNPTRLGRMTKPNSSTCFIANCFITRSSKDGDGYTSFQWSQFTTQCSYLMFPTSDPAVASRFTATGLGPFMKAALLKEKSNTNLRVMALSLNWTYCEKSYDVPSDQVFFQLVECFPNMLIEKKKYHGSSWDETKKPVSKVDLKDILCRDGKLKMKDYEVIEQIGRAPYLFRNTEDCHSPLNKHKASDGFGDEAASIERNATQAQKTLATASPGETRKSSFDNMTASPLPYAKVFEVEDLFTASRFPGAILYLQDDIHYGSIKALPLTQLKRKGKKFVWKRMSVTIGEDFEELKRRFVSASYIDSSIRALRMLSSILYYVLVAIVRVIEDKDLTTCYRSKKLQRTTDEIVGYCAEMPHRARGYDAKLIDLSPFTIHARFNQDYDEMLKQTLVEWHEQEWWDTPFRGVQRFDARSNFSPRLIVPFEILERIGEVSYRLALPPQLSHVHDVFHVSLLRGYHYHPLHVASYPFDQIQPDMSLSEEPESILDRQERVMRNKVIPFVKILWKNHPEREATWETEESMRASYPHFFV